MFLYPESPLDKGHPGGPGSKSRSRNKPGGWLHALLHAHRQEEGGERSTSLPCFLASLRCALSARLASFRAFFSAFLLALAASSAALRSSTCLRMASICTGLEAMVLRAAISCCLICGRHKQAEQALRNHSLPSHNNQAEKDAIRPHNGLSTCGIAVVLLADQSCSRGWLRASFRMSEAGLLTAKRGSLCSRDHTSLADAALSSA